jgi:hypothetical protein
MVRIILVGLGAGLAAALLFASVISGSMAAVFLFYLAPLPIMIAALGFTQLAGLVAATSATVILATLSGAFLLAVAVIAFGAWWLGYLSLLARPVGNGAGEELEWYPVGRLVLWAAVMGALVVAAAVPHFGSDQETLQDSLRKTYERMLHDPSLVDLLVIAIAPAAAVVSTLTYLLNLWLAARIVKISGRLPRPWPDLPALTFPPSALVFAALAIAASFVPDLFGTLSGALAASLVMAFIILGFAVLHFTTRGMNGRPAVLGGAYVASAVLGWPLLIVAIAGVAETIFDIRARIGRKQQHRPPTLRM